MIKCYRNESWVGTDSQNKGSPGLLGSNQKQVPGQSEGLSQGGQAAGSGQDHDKDWAAQELRWGMGLYPGTQSILHLVPSRKEEAGVLQS